MASILWGRASRRLLAAELGMSFLPVTDAIKRLEQDGLVESRTRVGARVRIPTAKDIREHFILREALEVQVARLFAEKASQMERQEMLAMAAELDAATEEAQNPSAGDEIRHQAQMFHLSFHVRIAECTGCLALCTALERNEIFVFNWLYDMAADHHSPPLWHSDLAIVLSRNDVAAADAAMRAHVRNGVEEIQARIVRYFSIPVPHSIASGPVTQVRWLMEGEGIRKVVPFRHPTPHGQPRAPYSVTTPPDRGWRHFRVPRTAVLYLVARVGGWVALSKNIETAAPSVPAIAWAVAALLFLVTVLNYMDRQTLSMAAPLVQKELHLDNARFGLLASAFFFTYGAMQGVTGLILDRVSIRWGYPICVLVWSMAGALTGASANFSQLFACRLLLGVGEAANWPAALRVVSRILPPDKRSFGNGLFNSGASIGAVITPPLMVYLSMRSGWRFAFVVIGISGLFWVIAWLVITR